LLKIWERNFVGGGIPHNKNDNNCWSWHGSHI